MSNGQRVVRAEVYDADERKWVMVGVESIAAHQDPAARVAYWQANADFISSGPVRDVHAAIEVTRWERL